MQRIKAARLAQFRAVAMARGLLTRARRRLSVNSLPSTYDDFNELAAHSDMTLEQLKVAICAKMGLHMPECPTRTRKQHGEHRMGLHTRENTIETYRIARNMF